MKRQEKREMPEAEKKYYRNLAREVLGARTGYYARKMDVTYGRISIREQKTRWGSCSSVGNLNYNWKLVLMPREFWIMLWCMSWHIVERNESFRCILEGRGDVDAGL